MLDIGWTELLVIAIVLIVVVGPKDLPPMIRAFGRTMANLRKVTGEFRTQFDQALKEADMDGVRKTIGDVQNLNPSNALRDAINPLRQMGEEIRSDLQKTASFAADDEPFSTEPSTASAAATEVKVPEPQMKLPDSPPVVPASPVVAPVATPAPVVAAAVEAAKPEVKVVKAVKGKRDTDAPKPEAKPKKAASVKKTETVEAPAAKKATSKKVQAKKTSEGQVE